MKTNKLAKLLKKQGTPEARFALNFLKKTSGKVWDSTAFQWVNK